MAKMVSLKKTASERKAEKDALGKSGLAEPMGGEGDVSVNLDHHHLEKLGVGGSMKSGDNVEFHGRGIVERSETRSSPEGDRHSATLRLQKGAVDHEPSERDSKGDRAELRGELEKNTSKMETEAK